jgi:hypothetical protein
MLEENPDLLNAIEEQVRAKTGQPAPGVALVSADEAVEAVE